MTDLLPDLPTQVRIDDQIACVRREVAIRTPGRYPLCRHVGGGGESGGET